MNEFEKHIKEQADAFKMNPLPDSFDKVMAALDKKKKRRPAIWWFLLPGIAVAFTIGFMLLQTEKNPSYALNETVVKSETTQENNTYKDSFVQKENSKNNEQEKSTLANTHTNTKNTHEKPFAGENENTLTPHSNITGSNGNTSQHKNTSKNRTTQATTAQNSALTVGVSDNGNQHPIQVGTETNEAGTTVANESRPTENRLHFAPEQTQLFKPVSMYKPQPLKNVPGFVFNRTESHKIHWSLAAYVQMGGSSSNYYENLPDSTSNSTYYVAARKETEIYTFSYTAGMKARISPLKWLSIETGIGYTHFESSQIIGNPFMSITSTGPSVYDTVFTVSNSAVSGSTRFNNVYNYITIPLSIYYQKNWKLMGIEAGAGVYFDIPVSTNSYAVTPDNPDLFALQQTVKNSQLNMFGIGAQGNIHVVFNIGRFSLYAGPVFKYRLNSLYRNDYMMKQHNFFIGGETGVRFNF